MVIGAMLVVEHDAASSTRCCCSGITTSFFTKPQTPGLYTGTQALSDLGLRECVHLRLYVFQLNHSMTSKNSMNYGRLTKRFLSLGCELR